MKRTATLYGALTTLALLLQCLISGIAVGEEAFTPIIPGMKLLTKGTPAPEFKVFDISGKEYDFAEQKKEKPHLLVFFSIFCEPCREEMPIVEQMHHEYKDRNLEVLAISMDGPPFKGAIQNYVKSEGYSFRFLLDEIGEEDFKAAGPYKVPGTTVLYLIDPSGNIHAGHLGRITAKELKGMIDSMLQEG